MNKRGLTPFIHAPGRKRPTALRISPGRSIQGKWPQSGIVSTRASGMSAAASSDEETGSGSRSPWMKSAGSRADGRPVASVNAAEVVEIDAFVSVEHATPIRPRGCGGAAAGSTK